MKAKVRVMKETEMMDILAGAPIGKFPMFSVDSIGPGLDDSLLEDYVLLKGTDLYNPWSDTPVATVFDNIVLTFIRYVSEDWS